MSEWRGGLAVPDSAWRTCQREPASTVSVSDSPLNYTAGESYSKKLVRATMYVQAIDARLRSLANALSFSLGGRKTPNPPDTYTNRGRSAAAARKKTQVRRLKRARRNGIRGRKGRR